MLYLKNQLSNWLFKESLLGFDWQEAGETLPSAIGKNYLIDNLSWLGWLIFYTLEIIEEDYTVKSIKKLPEDEEDGIDYEFWKFMCESTLGYNPLYKETYEKSGNTRSGSSILSRIIRK